MVGGNRIPVVGMSSSKEHPPGEKLWNLSGGGIPLCVWLLRRKRLKSFGRRVQRSGIGDGR